MSLGEISAEIGKGLMAGLAGTAVMTAGQMAEMKINDREGSNAPAEAVEKTLDLEAKNQHAEEVLSQLTHFAYGTTWGAVRGLLGAAGLKGVPATLLHFGLVWGASMAMMPAMDLGKPVTEQKPKTIGVDALHHLIYAVATGLAYEGLNRSEEEGKRWTKI
jgi:hypothetical protein